MAYPVKPDVAYSYSDFQEENPSTPLPANHVDDDYAKHKVAIDAIIDFVKSLAESDGTVKVGALPNATDLTTYTAQSAASATAAAASQVAAASSASAAAASAAAAASSAALFTGTSTSSLEIATGSKSFTTQAGKSWTVGQYVIAAKSDDAAKFMFGQVTSYSSTTLVVDVQVIGGTGTVADWVIAASGARGATGATGDPGAPGSSGTDDTGVVKYWHGRYGDIPSGWLAMNGVAASRSTYSDLFGLLVKSWTFTVTIASPAVVSKSSHGLDDGDPFVPTTSGALPTGLTSGTTYYVKAVDADSFQLTDVPGGTVVNTSGSQSGTHTGTSALCGLGDGSTTFNTPDWRGVTPIGHDMMGASAAGLLTYAGSGIYGRGRAIQGAENADVVNVEHSHSYGSARVTASGTAQTTIVEGASSDTFVKTIDTNGSGTTGNSGTASQKYKRVGRVAPGIWIIKT